jgi:hypothetical protein
MVSRNRGDSWVPIVGRLVLAVLIGAATFYWTNGAAKRVATQPHFGFWLMSGCVGTGLAFDLFRSGAQQSRLKLIGLNSVLLAATIVGAMVAESASIVGLGLWFIIMVISHLVALISNRAAARIDATSAHAQ